MTTKRLPSNAHRARQVFAPTEDDKLRELVSELGEKNWSAIAERMPQRNARQCKDRWRGYLRPNIIDAEWSNEEDKLLLEKYSEYGPRWSVICRYMPGRTEMTLKNRCRLLLSNITLSYQQCPAIPYPVAYVPYHCHPPPPPPTPPFVVPVKAQPLYPTTQESSPEGSAGETQAGTNNSELDAFLASITIPPLRQRRQDLRL